MLTQIAAVAELAAGLISKRAKDALAVRARGERLGGKCTNQPEMDARAHRAGQIGAADASGLNRPQDLVRAVRVARTYPDGGDARKIGRSQGGVESMYAREEADI
jgi:hypothetical protein